MEKLHQSTKARVPVVDMAAQHETVVHSIGQALAEFGFVILMNHGAEEAFSGLQQISKSIHTEVPRDELEQLIVGSTHRGYIPLNWSTLRDSRVAEVVKKPNYSESFIIQAAEECQPLNYPLRGSNKWPSSRMDLKIETDQMAVTATNLGLRLVDLIGEYLVLGSDTSQYKQAFQTPGYFLRLLRYPVIPHELRDKVYAAAPHTDYGFLTFVYNTSPGLQVLIDGEWNDVPNFPGGLVLNAGDLLQYWTNGVIKSAAHRVIHEAMEDRFTVAFFMDPYPAMKIIPFHHLRAPSNTAAKIITSDHLIAGEHVLSRLRSNYINMHDCSVYTGEDVGKSQ